MLRLPEYLLLPSEHVGPFTGVRASSLLNEVSWTMSPGRKDTALSVDESVGVSPVSNVCPLKRS